MRGKGRRHPVSSLKCIYDFAASTLTPIRVGADVGGDRGEESKWELELCRLCGRQKFCRETSKNWIHLFLHQLVWSANKGGEWHWGRKQLSPLFLPSAWCLKCLSCLSLSWPAILTSANWSAISSFSQQSLTAKYWITKLTKNVWAGVVDTLRYMSMCILWVVWSCELRSGQFGFEAQFTQNRYDTLALGWELNSVWMGT